MTVDMYHMPCRLRIIDYLDDYLIVRSPKIKRKKIIASAAKAFACRTLSYRRLEVEVYMFFYERRKVIPIYIDCQLTRNLVDVLVHCAEEHDGAFLRSRL